MKPTITELTPQFWVERNGGTLVGHPDCISERCHGVTCLPQKRIPRRLSTAKARCSALAEALESAADRAGKAENRGWYSEADALNGAANEIDAMLDAAIRALQKIDVGER